MKKEKMVRWVLLTLCLGYMGILSIISCTNNPSDSGNEDRIPPVITLIGKEVDTVLELIKYIEPGYTATDNVDGDITSKVTVNYGGLDTVSPAVGTYSVVYSVKDSAGNNATKTRKIVVISNTREINSSSLSSCPVTFSDTNVMYVVNSTLNVESGCVVTFGPRIKVHIKAAININGNGVLIVKEGVRLFLEDNSYISIGESSSGTLKMLGNAEDTIRLVNYTKGKKWGYGNSANYSGGLWFGSTATAACSLLY
ncbi:MAG: DUF5011 domain-containing protein, partial [Chitinispirillaceae bacterium]|nr:DUF5011 domain-containing protein [Chitinispirillaceae bacterium]